MKKYGYNPDKYLNSSLRYVYKTAEDGEELYLRIHLPKNMTKPFPVVLSIHGGGWIGGELTGNYCMWGGSIDRLTQSGIAWVETYYRLGSEKNPYPTLLMDCLDALDWIARDPENLGFDKERIALYGGSAGGHLCLMVALAQAAYPKSGREYVPVRAVLDCNGPTDLRMIPENHWPDGVKEVLKITFGSSYEETPDKYRAFSPIFYMDSVLTPPALLIIHGDCDDLVPIDQSIRLHEEAQKRGWDTGLYVLHHAGHDFLPNGFSRTVPCFSSIFPVAESFLKDKLLDK